jgi:hypothetical protein
MGPQVVTTQYVNQKIVAVAGETVMYLNLPLPREEKQSQRSLSSHILLVYGKRPLFCDL